MIITKRRFNMTPSYRGKWPFTVPEVAIIMFIDQDNTTPIFGIVHKFGGFALSGALEKIGFDPLVKAGIWAPNPDYPDQKKSLTQFFAYIQAMVVRELGRKDDNR